MIKFIQNYVESKRRKKALIKSEIERKKTNFVFRYLLNNYEKETEGKIDIPAFMYASKDMEDIKRMQAHLLYGIRHCPSVIRDVKKKLLLQGSIFYIDTEQQKGCDRYGNNTNWVKYILKEKELCAKQI